MRVRINTREITLPDNKSEVTLGQRLDFQTEHGDLLDKMADSISKMEDAPDKEVEVLEFYFEKVFRVFSFFSGVPVDDLRDGRHIDKILFFYNASLAACVEPRDDTLELRGAYTFKGERWELPAPELKQGDPMTFGEVIDPKQMTKDAFTLGLGEWYALLRICAVFLRRPGEPYEEAFLFEGSDRVKMMRDLPLAIAEEVAFFLSRSITSCVSRSMYLNAVKPRERAGIPSSISIGMGGSTSLKRLPRPRFLTYREAA